jgi:hypothetical protein
MNLLRYLLEEFPCRESAVMPVTMLRGHMTEFIGIATGIFILLWGQSNFEKKK